MPAAPALPPPTEARERQGRKRRWGYASTEARDANCGYSRTQPRHSRLLLALAALALGPQAASQVSAAVTELSWSSSSPSFPSQAAAVATDANGDVVVCGSWQSQGSPAPFVAKFSVAGAQRWRQQELSETAEAPALLQDCVAVDTDADTDVYIVASLPAVASGGTSTFAVLKIDGASGAVVWRRAFGATRKRDEATSMRVAGAAVVVGGFLRASDDSDDTDGFVMRLGAATGELQWLHRVASANGGDERVFGVDVDTASSAVFAVGDSTGSVPSADGDNSSASLSSLHGGDLFIQRIDAGSGGLQWSRAIGAASSAELCRLSVSSVANSVVNGNSVLPKRGNCAVAVSSGAAYVFVTGSTVGGSLSTDGSEQREFRRLCASTEALVCVQAFVARLDAASGTVAWLRQLVSRAGSTGERVAVLEASNGSDAVLLALTDAGFSRVDAMEQLAVLRAAGDSGDLRWLVDAGGEGPDRAVGLAATSLPADVLLLSASTRRRGSVEPLTSTLGKLSAVSGDAVAFCRDVVAFAANATTVTRPSAQTLVVVLPVLRVGSERCSGGSQAAGVTYATEDGSALGGVDFVSSRGVVQFAGDSDSDQPTVVAVNVLPMVSASVSVSFSVRLEASLETTQLGDPAELFITIEPPALVDKVQSVAGDGAFWRRLTRWATLAAAGGLLLLLGLRVGGGRRLLLARERMAFEYKSIRLRRGEDQDGDEQDEAEKRRARTPRRWWWRWRDRPARPSVGSVVAVAGVSRPPKATTEPTDCGDAAEDETALRSHLESIQSLNESLERLLLAPPPSPPSRHGPAAVTPAAASQPRDKKRRGLRRLLRSPRTRRRSGEDPTQV